MDLESIESLIKLMREHQVAELSFEDADIKVSVRLGAESGVQVVAAAPAPVAAAPAPAATQQAPAPVSDGHVIAAPMVGTFYRSPNPNAPAYVEVGAVVRKGQPLCIVEAMKLMNEIESDVDGVITEILAVNAEPVQFGQPLFRIARA